MFDVKDKVIVITGATGVLCSAMAKSLGQAGGKIVVLGRNESTGQAVAQSVIKKGGQAMAIVCDVFGQESLEEARTQIHASFGPVNVLINGVGGNHKDATTSPEKPFFDIPAEALTSVFNVNFLGTMVPIQVFSQDMIEAGKGVILNVSSMSAFRPLTKIVAYSAAKAAVNNLTQWLAVHMCQNYSKEIRVNAIAPGFFLSEQNRFLLTDEKTGDLTPRGQSIIDHTPAGRFGDPEDLLGTVHWLVSDASKFLTGTVIPVDGGFSAFSGV
jgi:NAD(P)-dependent dehydrogenase (short-subunit alcohol dehydrogenase family)